MNTKRLVLNALFAAMYVVLSYVSINLGNMRITLSGLPIILGAMFLGPVAGLEIGFIGALLYQVLSYGFTATTVLWILPAAIRGLMIGLYSKKYDYTLDIKKMGFIIITSSLVVTAVNTVAMYIDSVIYGYYSWAYVFGSLAARIIAAILTSVVYVILVPLIMKQMLANRRHLC